MLLRYTDTSKSVTTGNPYGQNVRVSAVGDADCGELDYPNSVDAGRMSAGAEIIPRCKIPVRHAQHPGPAFGLPEA
jgi:hypothetical protein